MKMSGWECKQDRYIKTIHFERESYQSEGGQTKLKCFLM